MNARIDVEAGDRKPAAFNVLQQQERFNRFIGIENNERPHQARAVPIRANSYTFAAPLRARPKNPIIRSMTALCASRGAAGICMHRKKINVSSVLAGHKLGIKEVDDAIWLVSFMHYDMGCIDLEQRTLQTFGTRLSPKS